MFTHHGIVPLGCGSQLTTALTFVMAVRHALTTTTSSAELISSLARPMDGNAAEILCNTDDMVEKCLEDSAGDAMRVRNRMIVDEEV